MKIQNALIIDACRTPRGIGKQDKSALAALHPQHLAATVLRALAKRTGIDTADLDDVIWSTAVQTHKQSRNLGRMAVLDAGFSERASATTLNRACGGGLTAITFAAASIMSGMEDLIIAGGSEMMSYSGSLDPDNLGIAAGNSRLRAQRPQPHQGVAADVIAAMERIGRDDLDAFGAESQHRAARAITEGRFDRSIVPILDDAERVLLDKDQRPRPQTTKESLGTLKPAFGAAVDLAGDPDGTTNRTMIGQAYPGLDWTPVHHAGTASGVVDGAAAILLASDAYANAHGLRPRARIVAYANQGDSPTLMLNGPVPAARKVLKKAGLTPGDIDLWEVNEAFAVVVEKFIRDMGLNREKVNVNGGAIALGHPIGATGAILVGTLLDELERQNLRRGLVTLCAAGGMAPAMIIERL